MQPCREFRSRAADANRRLWPRVRKFSTAFNLRLIGSAKPQCNADERAIGTPVAFSLHVAEPLASVASHAAKEMIDVRGDRCRGGFRYTSK